MPINEAQGYHLHSNLTPKQQQEAMENLYGLRGNMTPTAEDLSFEEVERLRRILDRYDKAQPSRKEFDLAKPPVPPYQFKPFPFLMYNHATGETKPARSELEQVALLTEGWSPQPFTMAGRPEEPLSAAEKAEAEGIDRLAKMPKDRYEAISKMSPEQFASMMEAANSPKTEEPESGKKRKT